MPLRHPAGFRCTCWPPHTWCDSLALRLRRLLAQQRESAHFADDRAALGVLTAAGPCKVIRACGARTHVGAGQEAVLPGALAHLLTRLVRGLAFRGGRLLRNVSVLAFRDHSATRRRNSCLQICSTPRPSMQLCSVVDDISTDTAGSPKMVTVVTHNVARFLTQGLNNLSLPLSARKSKVLGPNASKSRLWGCRSTWHWLHQLCKACRRGNAAGKKDVRQRRHGEHTKPHDFWCQHCGPLGVCHSGFHEETAQVSSDRRGQGGFQA